MKLSLVVGLFAGLAGCGGVATEPVTLTVTPYDSSAPAETTGHVTVPDSDYYADGCLGWALAPHPPALADDLAALKAANERAITSGSPLSSASIVVGDHHNKFDALFPVLEKGQNTVRVNFDASYRIDPSDAATQAVLADLERLIRDER